MSPSLITPTAELTESLRLRARIRKLLDMTGRKVSCRFCGADVWLVPGPMVLDEVADRHACQRRTP
jgi:hypothetical protein